MLQDKVNVSAIKTAKNAIYKSIKVLWKSLTVS